MRGESERHSTTAATGFIPTLIPMQSARPRATFRSRRSTCAGRRARSSSVKVRAQLSQLGVGAIERAFLSVFGHMKGHVCQRGRRNRQTQVMVYRMGISMEPVCSWAERQNGNAVPAALTVRDTTPHGLSLPLYNHMLTHNACITTCLTHRTCLKDPLLYLHS